MVSYTKGSRRSEIAHLISRGKTGAQKVLPKNGNNQTGNKCEMGEMKFEKCMETEKNGNFFNFDEGVLHSAMGEKRLSERHTEIEETKRQKKNVPTHV